LQRKSQVFDNEVKQKKRNEYKKLWIRKKRHKELTFVQCKQCLESFIPKRSTATFYSSKCRLKCHRANKSPAPSYVKDLEVYFDPNRADWYKYQSVEWFKEYGSKIAESTAFKADTCTKAIVGSILQLQANDYWKKFYPDLKWNEFYLEVIHRPA